ncbi:MAG: electron transfer flavoprotein subunit alpha/FixB family protein [archaeon]|nr:electron transfer flavoprotein subunit alpha/FixB family protein [archaeon]
MANKDNDKNKDNKNELNDYSNVWVFTEIQDHERILDCALELLTKGRELADKINQKLYSIVFSLDVKQYLPIIEEYGPDVIIYNEETKDPQTLKHYNGEIFTDLWLELINKYKPSMILFPSTEAGSDLAARLAQKLSTGLTAHCSNLDIIDSKEYGKNLLLMKRPAFSGNMTASILCPKTRPQMATVQQGIFKMKKSDDNIKPELIKIECNHKLSELRVINIEQPSRWKRPTIPIEKAPIIIAGGRGMGTQKNFHKLFEIADLLNAEVGTTRVPVFNNWCPEERMIGQTGKVVRPDVYIAFGISGQIQHTSSIVDSKRIISINSDPNALINNISDYVITEDVNVFIPKLIKSLRREKKTFNE